MEKARKLPSGNYRIRVYDKTTKTYKSFTASTRREAEYMAAEWFNGLKNKSNKKYRNTVKEAVQEYIDERSNILSPASIDKYQRTLDGQFSDDFKNIRLDKLTEQHIKQEVNRLAGKYSPKSVVNAYHFIIPILRKHRHDLYLDDITMPKVFVKKKVYPSAQEVIDLFYGDRMELEVILALFYGLRKEEIRGLKKSDITGNVLTINRVMIDIKKETIVRELAAKTEDGLRQINNLPPFLINMINSRTGEYVCEMSGHALYMHFKRKIKTIGYDIAFHDLRHVNASVMLFLGVPNKYAMERGGWSTDEILRKVYQSTFSSERQRYDTIIDNYFQDIYMQKYDTKHDTKDVKPRK